MTSEIAERIKQIAQERLVREVRKKKHLNLPFYLDGYHEAIQNILWDLDGTILVSEEWDKYQTEQVEKGAVKPAVIDIDKIKTNEELD